jgi:hypothetical protein
MTKTKKSKDRKDDTSDKPWVSNYPPLRDWLDKHDARCQWQQALLTSSVNGNEKEK